MGQKTSKDELVYQQVLEANVEAIKALHAEGVRLEWFDKEGKTPLIVASMDHRLFLVAKTLIELGANVNAYRPGRHGGTPLHHAAKRGLDNTVKLLLSNGANPFVRNDDCQTALDVARAKGCGNVVRAIEAHIWYFCGEICEVRTALGILEPLVPQRLSRKMSKKSWVVVVPCNLPSSRQPVKLELAVYSSPQDPQPRTVIALGNCKIVEPKFQESDPILIIFDESTNTRYKFLSAIDGHKLQLAKLYNACKGVPQVTLSPMLYSIEASTSSAEANAEAMRTTNSQPNSAANADWSTADSQPNSAANAIYGDWGPSQPNSAANAIYGDWGPPSRPPLSKASYSGWGDEPVKEDYNGWAQSKPIPTATPEDVSLSVGQAANAPSAPPIPDDDLGCGPIHYPEIDMSPLDFLAPAVQGEACSSSEKPKSKTEEESCCVICWEAPIEGACIPCGHMAGCMSCLTEIKAKKGVCPVCRTKMDQVVKLYAV